MIDSLAHRYLRSCSGSVKNTLSSSVILGKSSGRCGLGIETPIRGYHRASSIRASSSDALDMTDTFARRHSKLALQPPSEIRLIICIYINIYK